MILPPLVLLLFGTLEIGLMAKHSQALHHVAREAARIATTGATTSRIQSHIADSAPGLNVDNLTVEIHYRQWSEAAGVWGDWMTLADDGSENLAATGDQIRVQVQYTYKLATGMFSGPLHASEDNMKSIEATIVAMRE